MKVLRGTLQLLKLVNKVLLEVQVKAVLKSKLIENTKVCYVITFLFQWG